VGSLFLDRVSNKALGQVLVEKGTLTESQLEHALQVARETGTRLGQALVSLNYISQDALGYALAEQYGTRPVELVPQMIDPELLSRYPIELLRAHQFLPLVELGGEIIVLIGDLAEQSGLRALEPYSPGKTLAPQLANETQIRQCLDAIAAEESNQRPSASPAVQEPSDQPIWDLKRPSEPMDALDDLEMLRSVFCMAAEAWPGYITAKNWEGGCQILRSGGQSTWKPDELARMPQSAFSRICQVARTLSKPLEFCRDQVNMSTVTGRLAQDTYSFEITACSSEDQPVLCVQALLHTALPANGALRARLDKQVPGGLVSIHYNDDISINLLAPTVLATVGSISLPLFFYAISAVQAPGIPACRIPFAQMEDAILGLRPHCVVFDYSVAARELASLRYVLPYEPLWIFLKKSRAQDTDEDALNSVFHGDGRETSHMIIDAKEFLKVAELPGYEGSV
jgi:hypothetical protein